MENWIAIDEITPNPRNVRKHSRKQIQQIANSIRAFGFLVPILIDETGVIAAGHGRYAAAKQLQLTKVPVIKITGLSDAKLRAFAVADNRIAESAGWDRKLLATELPELAEILVVEGLDVSITGFSPIQIDQLTVDVEDNASDPEDAVDPEWSTAFPVSRPGDLWQLDHHRLLCGDPCNADHVAQLMQGDRAAMAFLNPPVDGHGNHQGPVADFGATRGGGDGFAACLKTALRNAQSVSRNGATHYVCTDWRHIGELIEAGGTVYGEMLNLAVWVKSKASEGFPYRNQHQLVGIFRVGEEVDQNKIGSRRRRRFRSDVWHYNEVTGAQHLEEHAISPVPVALVADAVKDCTGRGDIVLDVFGGCGTTLVAAERIGRLSYTLEIEPRWVDSAIRRWQALSGKKAFCAKSGLSFDELASKRDGPGSGATGEQPELRRGS